MNFKLALVLTLVVMLVVSLLPQPVYAQTWGAYSSELLTNPGAEDGNTGGWTAEGTNPDNFTVGAEVDETGSTHGTHTGSYCFFWNISSAADDWAYQEIDLYAEGFEGRIKAGKAQIKAGGWLVSTNYNADPPYDQVRLRVVLYDSTPSEISTPYDTGLLNIDAWAEYLLSDYDLPTNTKYVRLYFQAYEDGYPAGSADDLTVKVRTSPLEGVRNVSQGITISDGVTATVTTPTPPPGGGGGLSPPPAPPLPPGTTDVSSFVSADGTFTATIVIESADGECGLTINEGTTGLSGEGDPLAEIAVTKMQDPPAPPENSHIIGLAYDLGPDGATFNPPMTLTITYDESLIPEGIAEENLVIAMWDEDAGEWVELPSTVDPINHTITALVGHFTTFAIIAPAVLPPEPATFSLSNLSIQPAEVRGR